jgi:hypothetical protein
MVEEEFVWHGLFSVKGRDDDLEVLKVGSNLLNPCVAGSVHSSNWRGAEDRVAIFVQTRCKFFHLNFLISFFHTVYLL